jgi:threonine dehydratase
MGAIDETNLPTAADIATAAKRLAGVAVRTPLINAPVLDERLSAKVFVKAETLQRTGSFKFRGAYNKIASIPQDKRAAGVVAYSSGNHAQGVAAAARLLGMRATIVMPSDAPSAKRVRTEALGAEIVLYDRDTEDRAAIGEHIARERGATLVPPYDDPLIIAGQGTIGTEIVKDLRWLNLRPQIVLIGVSGGGLAAGIALGIKAKVSSAEIYAVEPEGFDDTLRSFASGQRETNTRHAGRAYLSDYAGVDWARIHGDGRRSGACRALCFRGTQAGGGAGRRCRVGSASCGQARRRGQSRGRRLVRSQCGRETVCEADLSVSLSIR